MHKWSVRQAVHFSHSHHHFRPFLGFLVSSCEGFACRNPVHCTVVDRENREGVILGMFSNSSNTQTPTPIPTHPQSTHDQSNNTPTPKSTHDQSLNTPTPTSQTTHTHTNINIPTHPQSTHQPSKNTQTDGDRGFVGVLMLACVCVVDGCCGLWMWWCVDFGQPSNNIQTSTST